MDRIDGFTSKKNDVAIPEEPQSTARNRKNANEILSGDEI